MAKCKCGNEQGKPRVSPYPVSYTDMSSKKEVALLYMGGFSSDGICWFCKFPERPVLSEAQREFIRSKW